MAELVGNPWFSLAALALAIAVLIAGGAFAIAKVRARITRTEPPASEWLTNFKEMHAKGELSDEEYRTIKAMLADQLQRELNSTDPTR